jgi:hypothetical protein
MTNNNYDQSGQIVQGPQVNAGDDVSIDHLGNKIDTGGGDFVTRDKIVIIHPPPTGPAKPRIQLKLSTVLIPAGSFEMGTRSGDRVTSHEPPPFTVKLPAYQISRLPVTNAEYQIYLRHIGQTAPHELGWENITSPSFAQEKQPVRWITWHEALEYCAWLTGHAGRYCTLPSEVQWERAARGAGQKLVIGEGVREWTTTLWGEKRFTPGLRYRYPWQPDPYPWQPGDSHDDLTFNNRVRRVTRGGTARPTTRSSELPVKRGLSGSGIGFRIVINQEE